MRLQKGFTLVELLVVISIIAILASILMVGLSEGKAKSRDSRRVSDIKNIQLALAQYYADNYMYPKDIYATGQTAAPDMGLAPTYMPVVPTNPSGSTNYIYLPYRAGAAGICSSTAPPVLYHIAAVMETQHTELAQDSDMVGTPPPTGFGKCTFLPGGYFEGRSALCTTPAVATEAEDRCYDQRP